jgi:hypothetical protein
MIHETNKIRAAGNLRKQKIVPPRTCEKNKSAEKKFDRKNISAGQNPTNSRR